MRLEFIEYKDILSFTPEFILGKEPLRIDLLIVKKNAETVIKNHIGNIFRKINIIEFKSPSDNITIDDYSKVAGYAYLYKGNNRKVNEIRFEDLTVSLVHEKKPKQMMELIKSSGGTVSREYPGIYYVYGITALPTQIVVTSELEQYTHSALRVLSENVCEEDAADFLIKADKLTMPGDRSNIDAVLEASIAANRSMYDIIKGRKDMNDILRDFFSEELSKARTNGIEEGIEKGIEKGIAQGRENALLDSVRRIMNSLKVSADQAMDILGIEPDERKVLYAGL